MDFLWIAIPAVLGVIAAIVISIFDDGSPRDRN